MLRGDANENSQKKKKQVATLRGSTFFVLFFELSKNNAKNLSKEQKKKRKKLTKTGWKYHTNS